MLVIFNMIFISNRKKKYIYIFINWITDWLDMFYCRCCEYQTALLKDHLKHHNQHRNITNLLQCGYNKCKKSFRVEISLRSHVSNCFIQVIGISSKVSFFNISFIMHIKILIIRIHYGWNNLSIRVRRKNKLHIK